jgi:hypothetical protein
MHGAERARPCDTIGPNRHICEANYESFAISA